MQEKNMFVGSLRLNIQRIDKKIFEEPRNLLSRDYSHATII